MVATPSPMLPLGTAAPDFKFPDTVSGQIKSLQELQSSQATVIMFICNHCPFVKHVNDQLVKLANLLAGKLLSAEQRPSLGCNIKWKE